MQLIKDVMNAYAAHTIEVAKLKLLDEYKLKSVHIQLTLRKVTVAS